MGAKGKKKKKGVEKQDKNDLPVFDSDHDFLKAFEKKEGIETGYPHKVQKDKHGITLLDAMQEGGSFPGNTIKEDFAGMLEASFKKGEVKSVKKPQRMPLKKRLKRYPPVEVELDLHGYTSVGAQVKVESFISNCKFQGFFTIRIIVGKGMHSDFGPVLPDVVEDVVRQMKKQDVVIAYEWDKKKKSKSGAVIVYLKQFEQFD